MLQDFSKHCVQWESWEPLFNERLRGFLYTFLSHEEIDTDKEEFNFIAILQAWQSSNAEARQAETRNAIIFLEYEVAYKSLIARKKLTWEAVR